MKSNKENAFTIVELVIVIAVIAILAAVIIPVFSSIINSANNAAAQIELRDIKIKIQVNILADNVWKFKDKNDERKIIKIYQNADGTLYTKSTYDYNLADAFNACSELDGYGSFKVDGTNIVYTTKNGDGKAIWRDIVGVDPDTLLIPSEGLRFLLYDDGTYKVAGIGECKDTVIVIPDTYEGKPVTRIGPNAFKNNKNITSIKFSKSITSIDGDAFYGCSGLTGELELPENLERIGESAFYYCSGLTGDLVIPDGVTSISDAAFYGCSGLTGWLIIPESVTSIGTYAFNGCSGLTGELKIPDSVTNIGRSVFYNCSSLESVVLPSNVESIGNEAFRYCSGLTGELKIPDSVTSIDTYAFSGCTGLTGVLDLPDNLEKIHSGAFYGCSGLTGELAIPSKVQFIGENAFSGCSGLTTISISNSLIEIGKDAFVYCSNLETITFMGSVEQWNTIVKDDIGNYETRKYAIVCIDGTIDKDGNVIPNNQ